MSNPLVSIIVLNYNRCDDTLDCLRSLEHLHYPNVDVIVVDNGSTDGSIEAVRALYPTPDHITLIETGANLGFTGGNNIGIEYALEKGADYIMLLNNDTIVAPDMLNIMINEMEKSPEVGVSGPMIYYYDIPDVIWSAGGSIDWAKGIPNMVGLNEDDKAQYGLAPREVDFVTGCALLVRRDVWEKVGLLDDKFFMYYEETQWCVRAGRHGFKILHIPSAMMWHKISPEERMASPNTYYYMTRNRLLFLKDAQVSIGTWISTAAELGRTFLSWTLRPKWQNRRHLRGIMLKAIYDASTGRWGKQTS